MNMKRSIYTVVYTALRFAASRIEEINNRLARTIEGMIAGEQFLLYCKEKDEADSMGLSYDEYIMEKYRIIKKITADRTWYRELPLLELRRKEKEYSRGCFANQGLYAMYVCSLESCRSRTERNVVRLKAIATIIGSLLFAVAMGYLSANNIYDMQRHIDILMK